jgi:hypothetical protein
LVADSVPNGTRVSIEEPNPDYMDYLEKRLLRRGVKHWILRWTTGVGGVISGDYFGWNFGLSAGMLAVLSLAATLAVEGYRPGVYGVAVLLIVAVLWFALYRRKRLVAASPEGHAALARETHGAHAMDAD